MLQLQLLQKTLQKSSSEENVHSPGSAHIELQNFLREVCLFQTSLQPHFIKKGETILMIPLNITYLALHFVLWPVQLFVDYLPTQDLRGVLNNPPCNFL